MISKIAYAAAASSGVALGACAVLLTASLVMSAGCSGSSSGSSSSASSGSGASDFVARPDATRHEISGKVVKVDAATRRVTLAHEAIPNYMEAMTMEFAVKETWAFQAMGEGDTLRGTLVVDGARTWIEGVSVNKASSAATVPQGAWTMPPAGTPLPPVTLVDQDGRKFTWDRLRGAPFVLTFIYTRCPLPDYCPLMMQRLAALEAATAADPALAGTRLLAVSIDPAFDTPAVLRKFGARYATGAGGQPFSRMTLATGRPDDVKRLAAFFGLDYFDENDQIMHALRTGVIDARGGFRKLFDGNAWTVDAILQELRAEPAPAAASPAATR